MSKSKMGSEATRPSGALWGAGLVLLLVAAASSLLLSVQEVAANFNLPGCGPASGCADIKNAEVFGVKVGMVPVVGWPVSYVGFAFFAAMTGAWVMSRRTGWGRGAGEPGRGVKAMAFVGAVVSVFYLAAMAIAQKFCIYCFATHAANLLFVGSMVAGSAAVGRVAAKGAGGGVVRFGGAGPLLVGAAVFVASAAGLGVIDAVAGEAADVERGAQRAASREEIIRRASAGGEQGGNAGANGAASVTGSTGESTSGATRASGERFAGRWEMGPEVAPIRIVIFSDYQCDLCRATEQMLVPLVERSNDIWLSVKHYPACTDCNPFVTRTVHPNACWAARAAETAGALGGEEAFWKMHRWLFARGGRFETNEQLEEGIAAAGIGDVAGFKEYLGDEARSLANVRKDIQEAWSLGITQTPMVFVNGVELRGIDRASRLQEEINALRAANLPAKTATSDRPPTARQKFVELWEAERDRRGEGLLEVSEDDWSMGSATPEVEVVMWGDYRFDGVPAADKAVRELAQEYGWLRYTFRLYPLERSCNEFLPERPVLMEGACRSAQVAEAAGRVGGEEGFWKMHGWLMDNPDRAMGDFMTKFAAGKVGLDGEALIAAAGTPEVAAAIAADCERKLALDPGRMPLLYVNGRVVAYRMEGLKDIVRDVLLKAREK